DGERTNRVRSGGHHRGGAQGSRHPIRENIASTDVSGQHANGKARRVVDAHHCRIDLLVAQQRCDHAHHRADADHEHVRVVARECLLEQRAHRQREESRVSGGVLFEFLRDEQLRVRERLGDAARDFDPVTSDGVNREISRRFGHWVSKPRLALSPTKRPLPSRRLTIIIAKQPPCSSRTWRTSDSKRCSGIVAFETKNARSVSPVCSNASRICGSSPPSFISTTVSKRCNRSTKSPTPYVAGMIATRSCPSARGTPPTMATEVMDVTPGTTSTGKCGQRRSASART